MIYDKDFLNTTGKESQSSVVAILNFVNNTPFITQLALLSPGWTLAVRNIYGLDNISSDGTSGKLVTVSIGTLLSPNDLHNSCFLKYNVGETSCASSVKCFYINKQVNAQNLWHGYMKLFTLNLISRVKKTGPFQHGIKLAPR